MRVSKETERLEELDPGAVLDDPLYTPQEIAQALRVSDDYVRRLFERQPGVIFLPSPGKESKRRHRTMRVPRSVLLRLCDGCKMGAPNAYRTFAILVGAAFGLVRTLRGMSTVRCKH